MGTLCSIIDLPVVSPALLGESYRQRTYRWPVELHPKGAVSGAEVPVLVSDASLEFAFACIGLYSGVQSVTGRIGRNPGPINAKNPRGVLGGSGVHAAFLAAVESGETGIRTLGTREGTPVFKTGRPIL